MGKLPKIKITKSDINGIIANQEFAPLVIANQVGDKFYVPSRDMILVTGQGINSRDRDGNEITDEAGNPVRRQVGQKFCAVRLIDGKPTDVRELYVGQLVKLDVHGRLAFKTSMSDALQSPDSSEKFKDVICGSTLEIVEEKEIEDRTWDRANMRWKRDDDDKFIPSKKVVPHFEPRKTALKSEDIDKANELLLNYYLNNYKDQVEVDA